MPLLRVEKIELMRSVAGVERVKKTAPPSADHAGWLSLDAPGLVSLRWPDPSRPISQIARSRTKAIRRPSLETAASAAFFTSRRTPLPSVAITYRLGCGSARVNTISPAGSATVPAPA